MLPSVDLDKSGSGAGLRLVHSLYFLGVFLCKFDFDVQRQTELEICFGLHMIIIISYYVMDYIDPVDGIWLKLELLFWYRNYMPVFTVSVGYS